MGEKISDLRNQIVVPNFGEKEKVDFNMNIYFITEDKNMKKLIKRFVEKPVNENKNDNIQPINYDRNNPLPHVTYNGLKFIYLEKENKENIEDLISFALEKIRREKERNIPCKNSFFIYLEKLKDDNIIKYIKLFIEEEFSEGEQPFILFITDEKLINRRSREKEIRNMIKIASKNYIKEKYKNENEEKEKRLKDLDSDEHYEYYMHYNIFLFQYKGINNNINNLNKDINNIDIINNNKKNKKIKIKKIKKLK